MTKEEFIGELDHAASTLTDLPVSSAMVLHLAGELKNGEPAWWKKVQKSWESRQFVAWSEAWSLFLACVHFEALSDAENPLVAYFPSCGGTPEADPSGALAKFLQDPPASFFENLKVGQRRSYVAARAPIWIAPATVFFQGRGLPFYAVEINAGAGLNLAADLQSKALKGGYFPDFVAARIGLDPKPLLLEDIADRRWLTAGIFPENTASIIALDEAADAVLDARRGEPNFIQLAQCKADLAPKFVAKNIPPEAEVGLLVLNMGTTVRMTDPEYERYSNDIAETMRPWGDRALWVEIENVRGERFSTTYQVRLGRVFEGQLKRGLMASIELNSRKVEFVKEGELLLLAGLPPIKKRSFLPWAKLFGGA